MNNQGRPNSFMVHWANKQEGSSNLLFLGPVCNGSSISFCRGENGAGPTSIRMTFFLIGEALMFSSLSQSNKTHVKQA
jgi:hypothetical protein